MGWKAASTTPKLGLLRWSCNVYQNVLASRNAWHATLFQYACALGTDGAAGPRLAPETGLCVINRRRDKIIINGTTSFLPSSLSDPHLRSWLDVFDNTPDVIHRPPEYLRATVDHAVFEVRITVGAHKVAGFDHLYVNQHDAIQRLRRPTHRRVLRLHPHGPCIDVPNPYLSGPERPQHAANIVDLRGESVRIGVPSIQIFAAYRDCDDPIMSIFLHGLEQSLFLRVEVIIVLRPHANHEFGVGGQGCRHSIREGAAVRSGIDTCGGESPWERLEDAEVLFPVCLRFACAAWDVARKVEAFPGTDGIREQQKRCQQCGGEISHVDC